MNRFLDDIRSEVKKGNYASALFLVLIVIVVFAIPVLWMRLGNVTDKVDAVRVECAKEMSVQRRDDQRRSDSALYAKDQQFSILFKEFNEFKDKYISRLEDNRQQSEKITKDSKQVLRAIDNETKKTKQTSKQLDSVSKSISI